MLLKNGIIGMRVKEERVMDNYKIEVSVEPYKGDLREEGNNFTHKEARYLQTVLYQLLDTWTHFNRLKEINPNE